MLDDKAMKNYFVIQHFVCWGTPPDPGYAKRLRGGQVCEDLPGAMFSAFFGNYCAITLR